MRKLLMFFVTLLVVTTLVFGQTWTLEKEETDIPSVMDAFFIDANTGWVILDDSQVDKTINGGATWSTVRADDGTDWNDIEFIDADTGYAVGNGGGVFKTTNGGTDWTEVGDTNYTKNLENLSVVDANTVYCAGGDTLVMKTVNGGTDWTYQISADTAGSFLGQQVDGGIVFTDANNGVVISDANLGYTWYTTDGGTTWTFKEIASLFPPGTISKRLYGLSAGGSTIAIAGYHNTVFASTDGGANYSLISDIEYDYKRFEAVDVIDDNNIIVSGAITVKTTDGGTTWDTLAVGSGEGVSAVSYVDANNGYVFLDSYQWFKTTNGTDFSVISEWPQLRFLSVDAVTDSKMIASSWGSGDLTETTDGGTTWSHPTNIKTGSVGDVWEIEFYDANNGLLAGDGGYLWITSDGGATWNATSSVFRAEGINIQASIYLDVNNILLGGEDGRVLKSIDGGVSWTELGSSGAQDIQDFAVFNANVVAVSNKGEMLVSNSAVDSFYVAHTTSEAKDLNAVAFIHDFGIVVSDKGYVYTLKADELDTLELIYTASTSDDLLGAEFINDQTVFIVGDDGIIINGNENKIIEYTAPTGEDLYDLDYANNKLWIVGDNGVIVSGDFSALTLADDLCINEFLASNDAGPQDANGDYDDYIEIYNMGSESIDIGGMYITDDLENPTEHWIPDTNSAETTIAGGGYLVIWCDKESEQGILHAEIKLSGGGEQVGLFQIIGDKADFLDSLTYDEQIADTSYGRYGDGASTWVPMLPTPGASNTGEVAVREDVVGIPNSFKVHQNFPNPFNPTTEINFDLPKATDVTISIYNVLGQKVTTLVDAHFNAGFYNVNWNATNEFGSSVASGVYIYKVQTNKNVDVKRMVYLK